MLYSIIRWTLAVAILGGALVSLNHAMFSVMATVAPPTSKYPELWAYEVYLWIGYFLALLAAAIFVAVNLRKGFPYLKSKWNILLLLVAIIGVVAPRANHFLEVDGCLDLGGRWNYQYQTCEN